MWIRIFHDKASRKTNELIPLQFELDAYRKLVNMNQTRSLLTPTTNLQEINQQSALLINKLDENIMKSDQKQVPTKPITKSEYTKCKSKKSKILLHRFLCVINQERAMFITVED